MQRNIVNLTPHSITVAATRGCTRATYYPQGSKLRLTEEDSPDGEVLMEDHADPNSPIGAAHAVHRRRYSAPETLPEPQEGTTYVVSLPMLMGLKAAGVMRPDLVAPDTGPRAKRDTSGQIVEVPGFIRLG